MDNTSVDVFHGSIIIHPKIDLNLSRRKVGPFEVESSGIGLLSTELTTHDTGEAWNLFLGTGFSRALEELSWDMMWEKQVAVQFEPGSGKQEAVGDDGNKVIKLCLYDRVSISDGNQRIGIQLYHGFDVLQRIRDHIIVKHLSNGDAARSGVLLSNATLLLSVEHFIKGLVNQLYALAEFYSVVETIENCLGGRHKLFALVPKANVDAITSIANQPQHDQRHAPRDAGAVLALPAEAIPKAAQTAQYIISKYALIL